MFLTRMPGQSFQGLLPALTHREQAVQMALYKHVEMIASTIVDRNVFNYEKMLRAVKYIEDELKSYKLEVKRLPFASQGLSCFNIEAQITGAHSPQEIVVVGAHYDSLNGSPAANDNASGVSALLIIAQLMARTKPDRTIRFVFFANEEMPFAKTKEMGSVIYAKSCKSRKEKIVGMISLETIGYYSHLDNSQKYPFPLGLFYPSKGNFVAFVGNKDSASLVKQVVGSFRKHAKFPSEGAALHTSYKKINDSDHWSFWQEGYPALMVTDTAMYRYPHHHTPQDTPDKLDYESMTRVVLGLDRAIADLVFENNHVTEPVAVA